MAGADLQAAEGKIDTLSRLYGLATLRNGPGPSVGRIDGM